MSDAFSPAALFNLPLRVNSISGPSGVWKSPAILPGHPPLWGLPQSLMIAQVR
jgi:hypothetical protein